MTPPEIWVGIIFFTIAKLGAGKKYNFFWGGPLLLGGPKHLWGGVGADSMYRKKIKL